MARTRGASRWPCCRPSMLGLALAAGAASLFAAAADAPATAEAQQQQQQQVIQVDKEPPCTTGLRDAINAGIVELLENRVVANELMREYRTVPYVPLLACPPSGGSPDPSSWPSVSDLHASDLLLEVLRSETLRVASYGPPDPQAKEQGGAPHRAPHGYDWGAEGNYSQKPYKGFLVDYLHYLVQAIGTHYKRAVKVEWLFYTSGEACLKAVLDGEAHITDIYFLQAIPEDQSLVSLSASSAAAAGGRGAGGIGPMQAQFYKTCPVLAASYLFVTKAELRISTLRDISSRILSLPPEASTVAYLTPANYRTLHFLLPMGTPYVISTRSEALQKVLEGSLFGVFMTGSLTRSEALGLHAVPTRVFASMGPWIRRTDTPRCLSHRFRRDLVRQEGSAAALAAAVAAVQKAAAVSPMANEAPGVELPLLALFGSAASFLSFYF
ncbi:hypothetical protein Esti_002916 [Eimeria stiedai]